LYLWFCIRIPITITGYAKFGLNTGSGNPAIVLVLQINNMAADFAILFLTFARIRRYQIQIQIQIQFIELVARRLKIKQLNKQ